LNSSNLILYDRKTDSYWAQMMSQSINGARKAEFIQNSGVIEATWGGPRKGQQLSLLESYASFWFAWASLFDNPLIHVH
jgi:hypothetical protein